jgi:hypothetical protein
MEHWWPPGHVIGWEHSFIHQYYEFLKSVVEDTPSTPSFYDGTKAQEVLEAPEQAAIQKRWVTMPQDEGCLPRS